MRGAGVDPPGDPDIAVDPVDEPTGPPLFARMSDLTRRAFLRRGAMTVGLASVAGAVPGLGGMLVSAEADAPAVDTAVTPAVGGIEAGAVTTASPLVAHVTDIATGQISLYIGDTEVVTQNPELASRLLRATGR